MKNFRKFMSGKGYYIALILCAVAIGISGYMFYRNSQKQKSIQNEPVQSVEAQQQEVEAVATQPVLDVQEEKVDLPVQTQPVKSKVLSPVSGNTALQYSMDELCYNPTTRDWRTHNGLDIAAAEGTTVCAAADGIVESVREDDTMGMTVVVSHSEGYKPTYSSLAAEVSVAVGQAVTAGDTIGTVGNTALLETALGEHLHFGVTRNGNPIDPEAFLALGQL